MTSTTERYQGSANYPTWAVDLWLSNDEGLYNEATDLVERAIADAPMDANTIGGIWSVEDTAKFRLADTLKEWIEEITREPLDDAEAFTGIAGDLLNYALGVVDWEEIATDWIATANENARS